MSLTLPLLKVAADSGASAAGAGILAVFYAFYFGMMGLFGLFYCLWFLVIIVIFILWLWMLIDCLKRENFRSENDKLLWAIIIVFAHGIGALLYYFLVKRKLDKEKPAEPEAKPQPVPESVPKQEGTIVPEKIAPEPKAEPATKPIQPELKPFSSASRVGSSRQRKAQPDA